MTVLFRVRPDNAVTTASYVYGVVGTSRCDVPARVRAGGIGPRWKDALESFGVLCSAPSSAGTARRAVPTLRLNTYKASRLSWKNGIYALGFAGSFPRLLLPALLLFSLSSLHSAETGSDERKPKPIPVAKIKHSGQVDFDREILPILKNNCLACHNKSSAKAHLVLETPQDILKGGDSGPAAAGGKGAGSLLLKAASHQIEDTLMPPPGNKVQASDLTPDQLGLIRLWIDQGARASTAVARPIDYQPLPEDLHPIYAVAVSPDGQYAACARANQIFLYHLPTRRLAARLADPQLAPNRKQPGVGGVAHRSIIHSLAFSADGALLASGAFREVKLWQRTPAAGFNSTRIPISSRVDTRVLASSPDRQWLAVGDDQGHIRIWNARTGRSSRTLAGHHGAIRALSFSGDGKRLASAAADRTLRAWEFPSGKLLGRVQLDSDIQALAWLPPGDSLVSGGADQRVRVWQLKHGSPELIPLRELSGHQRPVTALDVLQSPEPRIVSGDDGGSIRVWDPKSGETTRELKHDGPVSVLAAAPDGTRFASVGPDHAARLWNAADGAEIARLGGERHTREVADDRGRALIFARAELELQKAELKSAETNRAAQVDRAKKATEANEAAEKSLAEKQKKRAEAADAKSASEKSAEETRAAATKASADLESAETAFKHAESEAKTAADAQGSEPAAAQKAAAENAAKLETLRETRKKAEKSAAEAKNKEKDSAEKLKSAAKALDETDKELKKAEQTGSNAATELELAGKAVEEAGVAVAQSGQALQQAEQFEKQSESESADASRAATRYEQPLRSVAFSPDNRLLATAGDDGAVHLWSAENGAAVDTLNNPGTAPVLAVAFAGGSQVASLDADHHLTLWNLRRDWTLARVLGTGDNRSPFADQVNALAFGAGGRVLATGGGEPTRGSEIRLWQTASGTLTQSFLNVHSDAVFGLAFSPDGHYLASGAADRFVKVLELATGKVVRQFEGHTHHVLAVSWNRNGRTLASAGADNLVKFWDFAHGEKRKTVTGFDKEVTAVQFVGYTDQALAASGDSKVRLLREDGNEVRSFAGGADFIESAAVTSDGKAVVAGGHDGVLRVWNGADGKLIASFAP